MGALRKRFIAVRPEKGNVIGFCNVAVLTCMPSILVTSWPLFSNTVGYSEFGGAGTPCSVLMSYSMAHKSGPFFEKIKVNPEEAREWIKFTRE